MLYIPSRLQETTNSYEHTVHTDYEIYKRTSTLIQEYLLILSDQKLD
jgi:hypothetical protein